MKALVCFALALSLSACHEKDAEKVKDVAPPAPSVAPAALSKMMGRATPVGPRLVVLPGEGISATRFGATVATIERHMGAPCDVRSETRCVYVDQAVDFELTKGVVSKMRVEMRGRPVPGLDQKAPRYFGTFNGGMAPSILLGLHRHIVAEEFKTKPDRVETMKGPGALVEKQFFPGLVLEFDALDNGNVILAAFEVTPIAKPAP